VACDIPLKNFQRGLQLCLDLISIRGFHAKLWALKVTRIPTLGISGLPLGSPKTKWHLCASLVAKHRVYYKGEGGGFPQVQSMVSLVSLYLPMVRLCTKVFQLRTNQLVVWFVHVRVNNWCLSLFLIPIPNFQHTPLPPPPFKCYELGSVPRLLTLPLFSPQTHIWVYQRAWECVNDRLLFAPNMAGFSVSYVAFKSTNANCIRLTMDIKKKNLWKFQIIFLLWSSNYMFVCF
jgi:hypothetical protein